MTTILSLAPLYPHSHAKKPLRSKLTLQTAAESYNKLKPFLAFRLHCFCPADGWNGSNADHRDLFGERGFHWQVRWKPIISQEWCRLTYSEFCVWYGIQEKK